jgi:hypothetical protein
MPDIATAITGAVGITDKTLTLTQRVALYEQRAINLDGTGGDIPAGTYKLQITFGARTVALAALSVSSGNLAGTLNLSTSQLEGVFAVLPVNRIRCMAVLWDSAGKVLWGRSPLDIYRNEYTDEAPTPVTVRCQVIQGSVSLQAGATSATVNLSSYNVLLTASVAGSILKPANGDNMFVTSVQFDGAQIVFGFNGPIPATGYKLTWMVAQ